MQSINDINIDDVFVSSWGYDQTNVDFYRVTRKTKAMIELSPIPSNTTQEDGYSSMAGMASPDLDAKPGAPIGLRRPRFYGANGMYVRIDSCSSASKVEDPENYRTYVSWYA